MTMTPSELNVDQTTQLISDQFEVALNGSDMFWNAPDFATIDTGLLDPYLDPIVVRAITAAIVDEVELHVRPDRIDTVIRGRDEAAYAVETTAYVTYAVTGVTPESTIPATIPGFPTMPIIPGVTVPLILNGFWTARKICENLATRAGLGCVYAAPDYVMRENFTVNGPIINAIQDLVSPFNHFDPSKIDIWAENGTLYIQQRGRGGVGTSLDVHDTRLSQLMIRKQFLGYIGVLRLIGSGSGSGSGVAVTGFTDREDTDEVEDGAGHVVFRVITKERVRDIDGAVITQDITTYKDIQEEGSTTVFGLTLVSTKHTVAEWQEPIVVFPNQLINNPKEKTRVINEINELTNDEIRTTITHVYDSNGFLRTQGTVKETFNKDESRWETVSSEAKQYRDNGINGYQVSVANFAADGSPGDTRRTTARGQRPGGNGSRTPQNTEVNAVPVTYGTVISTHRGARDVTIQNNNLLLAQLTIIANEARAANASTEIEMTFTAAGMPWLRRGQYITLTGLKDEIGYTHDIGPALITEARIEYRESSDAPAYLTFIKASYWVQ